MSTANSPLIMESAVHLARRGDVSPTSQELLYNSLGFGIPAFMFFFLRISNRGLVMHKIRGEDWCMILAMCFYTTLLIFINYSSPYATNLYPEDQAEAIFADPKDVADRVFGSKLVIPLEQSMLASTWLVKLCIWTFVLRIAAKTKYERYMFYLLTYIVVGYLTIQVCYYAILCRPFQQYWAMPVRNPQCTTYSHYSIIQMVFNISSDLALFYVPLAIAVEVKLPFKRKALVVIPFLMGLATIMCAIMNKYYNFASPMTTTYQTWYIREASISIWVGNIICTWQLLQKVFHLRTFDNKHADIQAEAPPYSPSPSISGPSGTHNAYETVQNSTWKRKFLSIHIAAGNFMGLSSRRDDAYAGQSTEMTGTGTRSADMVGMEKEGLEGVRGERGLNRQVISLSYRIPSALTC
ncbi:hypothetical protein LHYA1_G006198 [Lachnellula hyalina]|uniref:Rhodopsin domain-containing protein n=1 Tax=Lachnellula hyalina TaxID=1316788 RepID=A0A8H8QZR1_9HELO|nr:uncharacterized protein LHYA1_G006198 [Lachnellula hyalina]TVY25843.1 hypothetical protein LHYA1_G006198 [Lachnellula hyalina]